MSQNALLSTTYNTRKRRHNSYRSTVLGGLPNAFSNAIFKHKNPIKKSSQTSLKFSERHNKAYLTAFVDLYAVEFLSYHLTKTPTMMLVMRALKPLSKYRGVIIPSNQGFHYQTSMFINKLKNFRMTQSMSRKSTPVDNAPIESFSVF